MSVVFPEDLDPWTNTQLGDCRVEFTTCAVTFGYFGVFLSCGFRFF